MREVWVEKSVHDTYTAYVAGVRKTGSLLPRMKIHTFSLVMSTFALLMSLVGVLLQAESWVWMDKVGDLCTTACVGDYGPEVHCHFQTSRTSMCAAITRQPRLHMRGNCAGTSYPDKWHGIVASRCVA